MKIDRISLSPAEAGWFSRNVPKAKQVLDAKAKREPQILERKTYKILSKMQAEAERVAEMLKEFGDGEAYSQVDVMLTRKQKIVLDGIVAQVHKGLSEKTIPAYENDKEKAEYLKRAIEKAKMLNSLARKLR